MRFCSREIFTPHPHSGGWWLGEGSIVEVPASLSTILKGRESAMMRPATVEGGTPLFGKRPGTSDITLMAALSERMRAPSPSGSPYAPMARPGTNQGLRGTSRGAGGGAGPAAGRPGSRGLSPGSPFQQEVPIQAWQVQPGSPNRRSFEGAQAAAAAAASSGSGGDPAAEHAAEVAAASGPRSISAPNNVQTSGGFGSLGATTPSSPGAGKPPSSPSRVPGTGLQRPMTSPVSTDLSPDSAARVNFLPAAYLNMIQGHMKPSSGHADCMGTLGGWFRSYVNKGRQ
jgi:hypothetical protein